MPISYSISHANRMVVASAEGEISLTDVQQAMMAVLKENAIPYAKLVDLTFAPLVQRHAGIRAIAERMNDFNKGKQVGPLAIVLTSALAKEMIELFDSIVAADRPMKIFTDVPSARAWLDSLGYSAESKQPAGRSGKNARPVKGGRLSLGFVAAIARLFAARLFVTAGL